MKDFFYRYKDTKFHRMNPLAKFLICAAVIVSAFLLDQLVILTALLILTALIALASRITQGWLFYMQVALWIGVFLTLLNLILSQGGDTILLQINNIPLIETLRITLESLIFGITMSLRLAVVISAFAILSLTLSPEEMMRLMSKFKVPAKSVFLASLSTRFIPSLVDDAETLSQLQKARGAKLDGIRGKGAVIIPLLSNSLDRSVAVAEAMEARGFSGNYDPNRKS